MVQPRTRQAKIALFLAAALLALATAEFAARYLFTAPLLDLPIYRRDTQGNLLLRPGLGRRHVTRHWDVTVAIHCCPVKSRIESIGWGHRGIRLGSRMAGVPVKGAFFRIA